MKKKTTKEESKIFGTLTEFRQPIYKNVKRLMPHCPVCGEMLLGDNSAISPFRCKCGEWKSDFLTPTYFKIKDNPL